MNDTSVGLAGDSAYALNTATPGFYTLSASCGSDAKVIRIAVVELKDVCVRPSGGSSCQNVVVKTGDKINISVTALPSDIINGEKLPFRWSIRQMQSSGSYGAWSVIPAGNDKSSFEYTTTSGGVFQVKVDVNKYDINIYAQLKRQTDDLYGSNLRAGDNDAFGVCDRSEHQAIRNKAYENLNKTDWNFLSARTYTRPNGDKVPYPANSWKCNLFVGEMGDISANQLLVPIKKNNPSHTYGWFPRANDWDRSNIVGWAGANSTLKPQPGYVWTNYNPSGPGHCGIVDYDGQIISAREKITDRYYKVSDGTKTRKLQ